MAEETYPYVPAVTAEEAITFDEQGKVAKIAYTRPPSDPVEDDGRLEDDAATTPTGKADEAAVGAGTGCSNAPAAKAVFAGEVEAKGEL